MRIAMISEHASPLGLGGQHSHVADLSTALAELGHDVRVYTRRDNPDLPAVVPMAERVTVVHVPVGPPRQVPPDLLLPHMGSFAHWLGEHGEDAIGRGLDGALHDSHGVRIPPYRRR